jgi:hypothetical protein
VTDPDALVLQVKAQQAADLGQTEGDGAEGGTAEAAARSESE